MRNKAITTPVAESATASTFMIALRIAVFLLVIMKIVGFVYIFFWGTFSLDPLTEMLGRWHVDEYRQALGDISGLSLLPLTFALLTVIAPLVGWWIYSRVKPIHQNAVGWLGALMYVAADTVAMVMMSGGLSLFGPFALTFSAALSLLYVMLFMGLGYNFAKLFKVKL